MCNKLIGILEKIVVHNLRYKKWAKKKIAWNVKVLLARYYSDNYMKNIEVSGEGSTYGERKGINRALMGKPEGKKPPGRRRMRWEDDIKIHLLEIWRGVYTV